MMECKRRGNMSTESRPCQHDAEGGFSACAAGCRRVMS